MPKLILLLAMVQSLLIKTYAQHLNQFTIDGTFVGNSIGKLYLLYSKNNKRVIDSAEIKNGKFYFQGIIEEPTKAELTDNLKMRKVGYGNYLTDFYLEQNALKLSIIKDHFPEAKISGSQTNDMYRKLTNYFNPVFERITGLQLQAKNESSMASHLSDSLSLYTSQLKNYLVKFVTENPDSYIGILAIQRLSWMETVSIDTVLSTFNVLTPRIQNTKAAIKTKEALVNTLVSSIGHVAPDFVRKAFNGEMVKLSSLRGHYVLLDFWASWCAPCRAQTPHLKKLYEKYSSEGLKLIGVSCDSKYDAWQKAIVQDSTQFFINILSFTENDMDFLQMHDNIGEASFEGELRKKFNLMPIPVYILLDPKGIIIGRYGATEKDPVEILDKKLSEIFDNGM